MNVDLSRKEIELILGRLTRVYQNQDEELLVYKLRRYAETREGFMRQYQQDFRYETKLPPTPDVAGGVPINDPGT